MANIYLEKLAKYTPEKAKRDRSSLVHLGGATYGAAAGGIYGGIGGIVAGAKKVADRRTEATRKKGSAFSGKLERRTSSILDKSMSKGGIKGSKIGALVGAGLGLYGAHKISAKADSK